MEIAIIGAGPIGCYTAYLLAKTGHQVSVYEKKKKIGLPIQCTGLLTKDFDEFRIQKKSFLVNEFQQIELNSPKYISLIQQKEYLVCREKFDNYFADLAQKSGVKIFLNHSFYSKHKNTILIKDIKHKTIKKIKPKIIIAADGPLSPTAKAYSLFHPKRKNYQGIQAVVKGKFDKKKYQTFFDNSICPELFAWIVPESNTKARVGLASKKMAKNIFDQFVKKHDFKVIEIQAGIIPLYHPKQKLKKGNCYLVGDASGFVKATTLGGLIPGLKQSQILVDCINNNKNYETETKLLKRTMKIHLMIRNIFNKFKNKDWDQLIKLVQQQKIKKLLMSETRENPLSLSLKIILKEPRMLLFLKYLF